jgi:hypothetical protein
MFDLVELNDGTLVVSGMAASARSAGYSLHAYDASRKVLKPMGQPLQRFDPRVHPGTYLRMIAPGSNATMWAARRNQYVIERWTSSGQITKVIARKTAWFQPWQTNAPAIGRPSNPVLTRVAEDQEGRLWVFLSVPSPNFKPLPPGPVVPGSKTGERSGPSFFDVEKNSEALVEVLDPLKGVLLASLRIPRYLYSASPFPLVVRLEEGPDDTRLIKLYDLILEPSRRLQKPR